MSKKAITQLFIGAALAVVVGFAVGIVAFVVAAASGVIEIGGVDVVTVDGDRLAGVLVWLVIASLLIGGGGILAIAAWVGSLFNTVRLDDKTWFILLLVLGLASFGWVAMIAYVVAGPDGTLRGSATGEIPVATAG